MPLGHAFRGLFARSVLVLRRSTSAIALGISQREEAICQRLHFRRRREIWDGAFNHEWDNPLALKTSAHFQKRSNLSGVCFAMDVPVNVNRRIFGYDQIIITGQFFRTVVSFRAINMFPGVSVPEVLNFFHWLGAVVTNPMIIGNKYTPVRKVVDRAGSMVTVPKLAFCMVVDHGQMAGLFVGSPENAWDEASDLSRTLHITYKEHPFHTVLSCAPLMYDELWVGGKCMYKLEPVVADGGELIIYAPHIHEISITHGALIRRIGYHCRDYFLKQWDKYQEVPWGVLAHSTHVRGIGTYEDGIENCRVQVTLATGITKEICAEINLGYRDPATIDPKAFANREEEGVLLVPKAGEMLYHLRHRPDWAREM
jgi:nickel-dependent lactate racemase